MKRFGVHFPHYALAGGEPPNLRPHIQQRAYPAHRSPVFIRAKPVQPVAYGGYGNSRRPLPVLQPGSGYRRAYDSTRRPVVRSVGTDVLHGARDVLVRRPLYTHRHFTFRRVVPATTRHHMATVHGRAPRTDGTTAGE